MLPAIIDHDSRCSKAVDVRLSQREPLRRQAGLPPHLSIEQRDARTARMTSHAALPKHSRQDSRKGQLSVLITPLASKIQPMKNRINPQPDGSGWQACTAEASRRCRCVSHTEPRSAHDDGDDARAVQEDLDHTRRDQKFSAPSGCRGSSPLCPRTSNPGRTLPLRDTVAKRLLGPEGPCLPNRKAARR